MPSKTKTPKAPPEPEVAKPLAGKELLDHLRELRVVIENELGNFPDIIQAGLLRVSSGIQTLGDERWANNMLARTEPPFERS